MKPSNTVSADVDNIISKLDKGSYRNKLFNRLVAMDSDLEILEVRCSKSDAKRHMATVHNDITPNHNYLLLEG